MFPTIPRSIFHGNRKSLFWGIFSPYLARFFFILAAVGRTCVNIGFIEHPLVLGFFYSLITGQFLPVLPLAVFFELFWLDLFPVGSYIPPFPAFPFLVILSVVTMFPAMPMPLLLTLLLVALPLAHAGAGVEKLVRERACTCFSQLEHAQGSQCKCLTWHFIFRVIGRNSIVFLGIFLLATALYLPLVVLLDKQLAHLSTNPQSNGWAIALLCATPGAILALRRKENIRFFVVCAIAISVMSYGYLIQ